MEHGRYPLSRATRKKAYSTDACRRHDTHQHLLCRVNSDPQWFPKLPVIPSDPQSIPALNDTSDLQVVPVPCDIQGSGSCPL